MSLNINLEALTITLSFWITLILNLYLKLIMLLDEGKNDHMFMLNLISII